ncbi:MAG: hypothetical protein ACKPKO_07305, partial [Candidatus Fonsibacter sp.]
AAEKDLLTLHGEGAKTLEEAFRQCITGEANRRLRDAKVVLRSTEPEVVQFLAMRRKKAHFCHANALAQQWFLSSEWHGLRGCHWTSGLRRRRLLLSWQSRWS